MHPEKDKVHGLLAPASNTDVVSGRFDPVVQAWSQILGFSVHPAFP